MIMVQLTDVAMTILIAYLSVSVLMMLYTIHIHIYIVYRHHDARVREYACHQHTFVKLWASLTDGSL
jgi:hypothetical protein